MTTPHNKTRRRRAALGALGVVAAAGALTGPASQADAGGFITAYFHPVQEIGGGLCTARVGVDINMSEADAQSFIAHPGEEATVKLFGDDPIWDNAIIALPTDAPTWPQAWAGGYSVEFVRTFGCYYLNEDWEGDDEVYAQVTFNDFRTGVTHRVNTPDQVWHWS
jgi:hypothetical protein